MKVNCISVGAYEVNCYILWDDSLKATIVDCGSDASLIIAFIKEQQLTVERYIFTHGHADHISGLPDLIDFYKAPTLIHSADLKWCFTPVNQIPPFYPHIDKPNSKILEIESSQTLKIGELNAEIIGTPGHTPGGVCLYIPNENILITGDTLFKGSVGRTDLPRGDSRILTESLKKLAVLPPQTIVYPGHGPSSTIEHELKNNFFMQNMAPLV